MFYRNPAKITSLYRYCDPAFSAVMVISIGLFLGFMARSSWVGS
ncbi:hypothetical protein HMPREF0758_4064 [Serratia odorifera DSM 4582]|uniref:Uncharacterized protein n=1 Tax=Serratia odorifera DSM 4582 TaxID=667129 RepID=D4E7B4_SEROD|nr:hypothetical protein HMPREF0758_4064 [Serratia odorifera DSM 4582]